MKKCVICGEYAIFGYGHNPDPIKIEGRCCGVCNQNVVIPARLEVYYKSISEKRLVRK